MMQICLRDGKAIVRGQAAARKKLNPPILFFTINRACLWPLLKPKQIELLDTVDYAIMLRTTNFSSKNYNEYKYITESAYNFLEKSKLYAGDIIMNKIGEPGAAFFVDDRGKPMSLEMNLFLLRAQNVDSQLVYLYLKGNYQYIRSFANGTSTKTITKEAVSNLVFPLAPLKDQHRLVS